ncbi:MAG: hypothetical protein GXP62_13670 [Oligoflexia bacterium]|nr:hypothetical protein [Oligoflexia bacterium]
MSNEVIDTNVLTIASAPQQGWMHPRIPLREMGLVLKVLEWVEVFRAASDRCLVLDTGGTILDEYSSRANMPGFLSYGRQVVQHKFQTNAVTFVSLSYWNNGVERVAVLPEEVEVLLHDLGDRKMVAAAFQAEAALVNACDSDWEHPNETRALALLGITLQQILTDEERACCRDRDSS